MFVYCEARRSIHFRLDFATGNETRDVFQLPRCE